MSPYDGSPSAVVDAAGKREIDVLMAAFFRLFCTRGGRKIDLTSIFDLFVADGRIVKNINVAPEVYDLQSFITPREKLLSDGTLVDFWEEEMAEHTDIFGNIAQRFSLYRKGGVLAGVAFEAQGMKTTQFLRTPQGWRIFSLVWDDCREGLKVPAEIAAKLRRIAP